MNCIEVEGVFRRYGSVIALDDVSFTVPCGGAVALLGPNGAGKTTMLRILSGILRPNRGVVKVCGFDMFSNPREAKACIGYLPEDAVPFLNLTVRENLEYVSILRGIDGIDDRVNELIKAMGLEEVADRPVFTLSKGNRQRVALAMAIIHRPRVLLLDEPLNYLDIPTQERVIKILRGMNENGTTILVSTHIMSVAERLATHVLMINRGRIIWSGSMNELRAMAKPEERIEEVVARIMGGG